MKNQYEGDPESDPRRDADWMWRGETHYGASPTLTGYAYNDPRQRQLDAAPGNIRWDQKTHSYRQGYLDSNRIWQWGVDPTARFSGGGGPVSGGASGAAGGAGGAGGAAGTAGAAAPATASGAAAGGGGMSWVGPAIQAGGQIGGAAMGGKGAKGAAQIQLQSNRETLAFAREQEAQRKAVYDQRMAQYTAMRNTLAQRYGIDIGSFPAAAPSSPTVPGAVPRPRPAAQVDQGAAGTTVRGLIQGPPSPSLDSWNQNDYGLPRA